VKDIPRQIGEALGGLATKLYEIGTDMIEGLLNGARDALGNLGDFVDKWIVNPFKDALGIHSPSTVMRALGVDTMDGYEDGVRSKLQALRNLLTGVAASVPDHLDVALRTNAQVLLGGLEEALDIKLYNHVQIGDKPVEEMVEATLTRVPQAVYRASAEGQRRAGYVDPSRRFGGSRA
jgi:hypothetical protein